MVKRERNRTIRQSDQQTQRMSWRERDYFTAIYLINTTWQLIPNQQYYLSVDTSVFVSGFKYTNKRFTFILNYSFSKSFIVHVDCHGGLGPAALCLTAFFVHLHLVNRAIIGKYWSSSFFWKFRWGPLTSIKGTRPIFSPKRTEQAISVKDLLLWLFISLRTAKGISISKRALQRRNKGTNDFCNGISTEGFAKIIGKKARTRFRLQTNCPLFLKFSTTPFGKIFSWAVHLNGPYRKIWPLREPTRKLLFSPDQLDHITNNKIYLGSHKTSICKRSGLIVIK